MRKRRDVVMRVAVVFAVIGGVPVAVAGQVTDAHAGHSEHAGKEGREIKALDPADVEAYLAGAGMGFALAAELNAYPGPRHVLELADELRLTAEQRAETQRVFERMQEQAVSLGREIVELEKQLDQRFAHRHIDAAVLTDLTGRIAALNGRVRAVHLLAHIEVTALLDESQIARYDELRGYR
jgi:hypothetical protein